MTLLSTLTPRVRWWHKIGVFPALVVGGLASCAATWPKTVERPPPQYEVPLEQIDPAHEVGLTYDQLQAVCTGHLGPLTGRRYWRGCYVPDLDVSYYIADWPSKRELEAIRIHENGHRLGWRHEPTAADFARAVRENWR